MKDELIFRIWKREEHIRDILRSLHPDPPFSDSSSGVFDEPSSEGEAA